MILLRGQVLIESADSLTLFDDIVLVTCGVTFLILILCMVFALIMHFLMPKQVVKTYFKKPYFNPFELSFFSGFPFGYYKSFMFMRVLGVPSSGKKRGLTEAYKLAPVWYCKVSKYFIYLFLFNMAVLTLSGMTGFIRFEAWKL